MKIVVGLGNPGRQYAATRHNIGYDVIDALSVRLGWTTGPGEFDRLARTKFDGLVMDGTTARGSKLLLLKPTTFMNLSGTGGSGGDGFLSGRRVRRPDRAG